MRDNQTLILKLKKLRPLLIFLIIYSFLYFVSPLQAVRVYGIAYSYMLEIALIVPPVFILMGLFEIWIPKELIQKYMGIDSGVKGILLAFFFGTLPTGPVYIAFPIASALFRKGARLSNMIVFLSVWAAAKLPQLMVEVKFLGASFMALRLLLTVTAAIAIGYLMEAVAGEELSAEIKERAAVAR
ncbi:MAG: permease [Dethiobacteria bacterium]|jgi:uncharacterized membrane protein YraQ (UPF0718 family)